MIKPHFPAETPELDAELAALPHARPKGWDGPIPAEDTNEFRRAFSHPICMTCGMPQCGRIGEALVRKGIARPPILAPPEEDEEIIEQFEQET